MDKKIAAISKDKAQRRKKILQDMMRTIVFYEAKGRVSKNVQSSSQKKKPSAVKKKVHKQGKSPHKNTRNEENIAKKVNLTDEEKQALNELVVEIQNQDFMENKSECKKSENNQDINEQSIEEMHEISYTYNSEDCLNTRFFDFNTEFDAGMLWEDTNLDDYADLFTDNELKILKDKQRQLKIGTLSVKKSDGKDYSLFTKDFEISEDDYEEESLAEDDYLAQFEISEDDYE